MTNDSPLDRHKFSIKNPRFSPVGEYAWIGLTVPAAGPPTLVSMTDREIEVPAGTPILDHLMDAAGIGAFVFLTRQGRRMAAIIPADVAESIMNEPPGDDDGDGDGDGGGDGPTRPTGGSPRTLDDLRREQGVQPVRDPAELRGPEMDDFEAFFSAAMSARPR